MQTPENRLFTGYFRSMASARKKLARELYLQSGMDQKEIAEAVGVTENTMSRWVQPWKREKELRATGMERIVQDMMDEVIEITDAIKAKPAGQRYADSKTADARNKILAGVQRLRSSVTLSSHITVMLDFLKFAAAQEASDTAAHIKQIGTHYLNAVAQRYEDQQ